MIINGNIVRQRKSFLNNNLRRESSIKNESQLFLIRRALMKDLISSEILKKKKNKNGKLNGPKRKRRNGLFELKKSMLKNHVEI